MHLVLHMRPNNLVHVVACT
ncbi:hypothetical protein F383_26077 [Gossypium arboreum]|uniref:Uncharacterized protein n=1 Tax=Gossypium arboreum TaxID=29729 RepID=A0A0B0NW21_GOSAR|nr:hypothetical protein F383_26077 [Gossypium arboreum]